MSDEAPTLDDLIGKIVVIGITRVSHSDEPIEQRQYAGTFVSMEQTILVRLTNGEDFTLPPDLSAFRKAKPGIYRLRSTGEEIENPDFTASWTVRAPAPTKK